jgi:hypothetical protein
MAININHPNDPNGRVDAPEVRIAGKEVNTTDGTLDSITRIYSRDHQRVIGNETQITAKDVDNRASDAFSRSVTVTINPDAATNKGFHNNQPVWRKAVEDRESNDNNIFYGEQDTGIVQNETMYTYYTLNGKDPSRTKAQLYTGPFTVRQNKSGGDNYVLKTRSYINGIASPVRRVDFRIVDLKSGNKQVNKLTIDASAT